MATATESAETPATPSQPRRAALTALIGQTIEYYDFYLYGTAAALVLGRLFFPSHDQSASTLAAFATFAAGFLLRPVGAIVFGHLGDRIGRKSVLVTIVCAIRDSHWVTRDGFELSVMTCPACSRTRNGSIDDTASIFVGAPTRSRSCACWADSCNRSVSSRT